MTIITAIQARRSCRTYGDRPVEPEKAAALTALYPPGTRGPFGNPLRFRLLDIAAPESGSFGVLGTYGVIQGTPLFLIGAVGRGPRAMEDYGYALERIVVEATALGLGTCWLGGTFKRRGFARAMDLAPDELMPAITPLGYPGARRSLTDRFFRFGAGADQRRPWKELFFADDVSTPLSREAAGPFATALECVRRGPSASNKQPWRVIREGEAFHFYLCRTPGYEKLGPEILLQNIDLGIALCHFQLAAGELGLTGRLATLAPVRPATGWEYISSWTPTV